MSQYPRDEFDDVTPYQEDELGKHRAPGGASAAPAAGSGSGGGLKWLGLLAVVVAVVVVAALVIRPFFTDDEEPAAGEGEETQAPEGDPDEENGEGEGNGEEGGNGEDAEDQAEIDMEIPVRTVNAGGPGGAAGDLEAQLTEQGYNVVDTLNWNADWGPVDTPAIFYSDPEEQEFVEYLASDMGIDTIIEGEGWQTLVVVVGDEYELSQ